MSHIPNSNKTIEKLLDKSICKLENQFNSDVIAYSGDIEDGVDTGFRDAIESIKQRKRKAVVVLETLGGYIEVAERIVDTLREHYDEVDFCVPGVAMSAGTVLVMSGDAIHMDYYSRLGPIDPQVQRPGGKGMIPALGYLVQYERLLDKDKNQTLTTTEAAILIDKFDQAELFQFEQSRELSITLLKEWLTRYKFKSWVTTATRAEAVTPEMRQERAEQIAAELNNTQKWHSHSRGISMKRLREVLKLQIEDYGLNAELKSAVRSYHRLFTDYLMRRGQTNVIHARQQYLPLMEG